ncbi:MAG: SAM-dependent methyltransferase [Pseudomonadota bacterium]
MAFDQTTRNRLQRFVNEARRTLEEEFTRQLQNDYGLDPVSGAVTPIDNLRHLNDAQRETARILRDTLAHYWCQYAEGGGQKAEGGGQEEQGNFLPSAFCQPPTVFCQPPTVITRIVREQAFTVLNRLAALRMAEARGLLIESVGNGYQAKGFQLYARLAGTGLGETGDAYRVYLFSVFDELAQDLPSLFDRYSPQGRLFPREAALLAVLTLINDPEIEPLWAEDETIGWIYQYFNSQEERKSMREARAPRNSRELAVRNQFFTPRYVVEFLVDNTLGRLWFNATGGQTALRDRCQYLLVKPDEQPQGTVRLRDPRTLKLLDPACGSMHFGLYAFDLFLEIYREAWAWEQQHGPGSLDVSTQPEANLRPLCQTYPDEVAFLRDVPRLIVEQNIYGVDIDPRAAQIATLALWLRAQRAWHDGCVQAKDRPAIGHGHVLAAVAPPAERELRQHFAAELDHLDAELFEKTLQLLKGLPELGVLLQVERELPHLIREVYGEHGPMFKAADMEQWRKAEGRLREALTEFAHAAQSNYQGRLFAQDALQGLRLIDLCREMFDVVVMNPPFGALASNTKDQLGRAYPRSKNDLLAIFVERGLELLRTSGRIGAITSRTCFFLSSFQKWREQVVLGIARPEVMADLGHGVMDDAMVEAAAYVLEKQG